MKGNVFLLDLHEGNPRIWEILAKFGRDRVAQELWSVTECGKAGLALRAAIQMSAADVAEYAAKKVLANPLSSEDDKRVAKNYLSPTPAKPLQACAPPWR
ncbi:MAG: hypothetical protein WCV84_04930 [Patescibacteria group bacterium]